MELSEEEDGNGNKRTIVRDLTTGSWYVLAEGEKRKRGTSGMQTQAVATESTDSVTIVITDNKEDAAPTPKRSQESELSGVPNEEESDTDQEDGPHLLKSHNNWQILVRVVIWTEVRGHVTCSEDPVPHDDCRTRRMHESLRTSHILVKPGSVGWSTVRLTCQRRPSWRSRTRHSRAGLGSTSTTLHYG